MAFFTTAALVIALLGLTSINRTARDIAHSDLVFISSANKLQESLRSQERNAIKAAVLKSAEFNQLYRSQEKTFLDLLDRLDPSRQDQEVAAIRSGYDRFRKEAHLFQSGGARDSARLQQTADRVAAAIEAALSMRQSHLDAKLAAANERRERTVTWTLAFSFTGVVFALLVAAYVTYRLSTAVRKLKRATRRIAEGDFDHDPNIPVGDEFGDLAADFVTMAGRLKVLEQMSLDASPLTRLPGNIAIERVLTRRLHEGVPFAVCYADLDNLKAYNDHYGYIQASELIRTTGEIIRDMVGHHANDEAFVGHVGGDDFVMVIGTDEVEPVCNAVIARFSEAIPPFYDPGDLEQGGIETVDRYGVQRTFPIMTISIAVVICSQGEYESAVDIARTAAEIKDYVKGKPGSNYLVNRRRYKR